MKHTLVIILSMLLIIPSFSSCIKPFQQNSDAAAEEDDQIGNTAFNVGRDRLIVYSVDKESGEYSETEAYCHMLYASSSDGESGMEIDCISLFDMLPGVIEELPVISASRFEIGLLTPDTYAASVKAVEVFSTLPSGEIMIVDFNTFDEALSYAQAHFEDMDAAPVIDVIMYFKNRDAGIGGLESGEEGYAFKLVP